MASSSGSFYDLLGVDPTATSAEIRHGYLKAAQESHPDRNRDDTHTDRRFKQIRRVYEILNDPVMRATYDEDPTRFRLTDTGVVMVGSETVIARPSSQSHPWPTDAQRRGAHRDAFKPNATTGRHRIENIWVFVGGIAAVAVFVAASVFAVRQHRSDVDEYAAQEKRQRQTSEPMLTPPEPRPPLGVVMESLNSLRDEPAASETEETAKSAPPTEVNLVDEFNSPDPGWPNLPLPPPAVDPDQNVTSFEPPAKWEPSSTVPTVPSKIEVPDRLLPSNAPLPSATTSGVNPLPPPLTSDQDLYRMNAQIVIEQARQRSQMRLDGQNQIGLPFSTTERSPVPSGIMDPGFTNKLPLFPPSSEGTVPISPSWRPSNNMETRPLGAYGSLSPSAQLQHGPMRRAHAEFAPRYDGMDFAKPGNTWQPTGGYRHRLNTAAQSTVRPNVGTPLRSPSTTFGGSRLPSSGSGVLRSRVTPPSLLP